MLYLSTSFIRIYALWCSFIKKNLDSIWKHIFLCRNIAALFCSSIILDELPAWSFGQTRQAGFPHWLRGRRRASHFPMPGRLFIGHSYARHVSLSIICFPALFYLVNHYTLGFQICSVLPCTRTGVYTFMRYEAWANQKGDSVTRWRAILHCRFKSMLAHYMLDF